ncbi:MAG: metallophosphoesterase [Verrucomicrobiales bacterium]|nr:metallophosphoesterase [Verrucomicrobiales bacterium]
MPLTLPQLSRREFLKRAALAGTAASFVPSLFAELAVKPGDPDTFFFLSDTHIAGEAATISHGVNMTNHLSTVVREVLAWPVAPAAIIVNGDLAFKLGLAGDYTAFGKLIEPLRALAPMHLTLGNHDQRDNFWQAFPLDATKSESVPQKQVAILSGARANWFLLDSLDITGKYAGQLGAAQIEWLVREIEARPDKPALVVCHHHLDRLGEVGGLKDSTAMIELLANHRQVKAFIYGHTHNWHVSQHEKGLHLVNLPPTAYVFEPGRPSGWVCAKLSDNGAELELRSLDQKHPELGQMKRLEWRTS